MRFTISREKLQEGLSAVASVIPAKTTLPVLANLLVETTERGIRLAATDLDIGVSTEVTADVEAAGAMTIPAKKLAEIARELPPHRSSSPHRASNGLPSSADDRNSNCSDFPARSFRRHRRSNMMVAGEFHRRNCRNSLRTSLSRHRLKRAVQS